MNLVAMFAMTTVCTTVPLGSLEIDRPYRIVSAERVKSQFGPSVALTLSTSELSNVRVFLPKRYAELFRDSEIDGINSGHVSLDLLYTGRCPRTKAYNLALQLSDTSPPPHTEH
jgi:hypothetical protein